MQTGYITNRVTCYTIAFTLRSGSNLLCDYLRANGLGQPAEYFQHPFGVANKIYYDELGVSPTDFKGFLSHVIIRKSQNGIFGSKLTWDHKNVLVDTLQKSFGDLLDVNALSANHQWIYLTRQDKFDQAVSAWRATKSGQWSSNAQPTGLTEPEYDFFGILSGLYSILTEELLWEGYFRERQIQPLRVFYEDLRSRPAGIVLMLARVLLARAGQASLDSEDEIKLTSSLTVQRDAYSSQMKLRLIDDLYHIGVTDYWRPRDAQLKRWLEFFIREGWK